ncbi:MAG: type 1 glutamine amidotransferase, partial [Rhodothermales bacterium]
LGCHHVTLTPAGQSDPLFGTFPQRFLANMGHHDRVVELPSDAVELAFSDTQPFQAFRVEGRPMYGTQFHSELDARRERERLYRYRENYPEIAGDAAFQTVLDNLAETSDVDHLLSDFLTKMVLEN